VIRRGDLPSRRLEIAGKTEPRRLGLSLALPSTRMTTRPPTWAPRISQEKWSGCRARS